MTIPDQAAILAECAEQGLIRQDDLVNWACKVIEQMAAPPIWLVEVATMTAAQFRDAISLLRERASPSLPSRRRIQISVIGYFSGESSLFTTLSNLFKITLFRNHEAKRDALDERLEDTLVAWDCSDELEPVQTHLQEKFEKLFREYLVDAQDIVDMLPLKYRSLL